MRMVLVNKGTDRYAIKKCLISMTISYCLKRPVQVDLTIETV